MVKDKIKYGSLSLIPSEHEISGPTLNQHWSNVSSLGWAAITQDGGVGLLHFTTNIVALFNPLCATHYYGRF